MSRSGYSDDIDDTWQWIKWRGQVASAIRGKRGQAFLKEMLAAMDAMPEKKLVANALEADGQVCAIGTVGRARGVDMSKVDPEDYSTVAGTFGIAEPLAQEIVYMNDEAFGSYWCKTPEDRFQAMRAWIVGHIRKEETA
ncbi:hypothetical protein LB523_12295 [Mesorhizobium sp. ESP-6-4]|uniref:hypothetical protein n=1 Tax=Mesorhizobium sp. ESP-6-4 TaxID=2876624 RepID=UPI001CC9B77E|nr:hypothetical protein [Mesorhizobium sp. ESP-6-4]MBZ9659827.1 hypothetical protein [Mesorhizobium sp. ESP-6-4]